MLCEGKVHLISAFCPVGQTFSTWANGRQTFDNVFWLCICVRKWLTTLIQIVRNLLLRVTQNDCPNIETIGMPYIWIFVNVGNTYFH
jgi:hypothetical protein